MTVFFTRILAKLNGSPDVASVILPEIKVCARPALPPAIVSIRSNSRDLTCAEKYFEKGKGIDMTVF